MAELPAELFRESYLGLSLAREVFLDDLARHRCLDHGDHVAIAVITRDPLNARPRAAAARRRPPPRPPEALPGARRRWPRRSRPGRAAGRARGAELRRRKDRRKSPLTVPARELPRRSRIARSPAPRRFPTRGDDRGNTRRFPGGTLASDG